MKCQIIDAADHKLLKALDEPINPNEHWLFEFGKDVYKLHCVTYVADRDVLKVIVLKITR